MSKHIIETIDREIEKIKDQRIDQGQEELADSEIIFTKMSRVEKYTDDSSGDAKSKRYDIIAKSVMDRLIGLRAEIDPGEFDQLNVRENLKKIVDIENIRTRGFNTAVNSITSILDTSKMGYQYIENFKNARELIIREYEDTDAAHLPDERYAVKMRYYDSAQLIEERKVYDIQLKSLETEIQHLWDVLDVIYEGAKPVFKVFDFNDLSAKQRKRIRKALRAKGGEAPPAYEEITKVWDELTFVKTGETEVERMNRTYIYEKDKVHQKIILMRNRMKNMYDYRYPVERRVMEDRLSFLEREYNHFDYVINPYHIQPGLLLDVDITSLKRKKVTLNGMANVLNEFLHGVSKGFQDAAFASFSRRRSTVRDDIAQSFADVNSAPAETPDSAVPSQTQAYLDILNADGDAGGPALVPVKAGRGKAKVADARPKKSGRGRPSGGGKGRRGIRQI